MNTRLEFLFERYSFSEKDRFEIRQFFWLLSSEKQKNFITNFPSFAEKVKKIDSDIETEKSILIDEAVERITNKILKNRKKNIDSNIKRKIESLKGEF